MSQPSIHTNKNFVNIAFPLNHTPVYSYHFAFQEKKPFIGTRVLAPIGSRKYMGFIVGYPEKVSVETKSMDKILDQEPLLTQEQVDLLLWCEKKYAVSAGEMLQTILLKGLYTHAKKRIFILPQSGKPLTPVEQALFEQLKSKKMWDYQYFIKNNKDQVEVLKALCKKGWVEVAFKNATSVKVRKEVFYQIQNEDKQVKGTVQKKIVQYLRNQKKWISKSEIKNAFPQSSTTQILNKLLQNEVLTSKEEIVTTNFERVEALKPKPILTPTQQGAYEKIVEAIDQNKTKSLLLHGVTGSGKTEIYLQAAQHCLDQNKNVLALVPEISLTPQFVNRFYDRFGEKVALLHSQRTDAERLTEWHKILEKKANVVIGTRSAVFSPLTNIGLIILDEFHDYSYKQQEGVRYHAKDIAFYRSEYHQCPILLGSATPDIETYYQTPKGSILELKERVTGFDLPSVEICDVKSDPDFGKKGWISHKLRDEIETTLLNEKQVLLFLNRRGYAHIVYCYRCGKEVHCPHCSVTMTFHKTKENAQCHYCFYEHELSWKCPSCKVGELVHFGTGTQKLEEELSFLFPDAVISRLDRDQTSRKNIFSKTMREMAQGKVDILIGTQMITKGLDLPNIGLVGILLADQTLHFPDFRSSESTFNLITQVVGRSGRGDFKGKAFIQTLQPKHDAIVFGAAQDYTGFYEKEIQARQALDFPPFSSLVLFEVTGTSQNEVESMMQWLKHQIERQDQDIDLLGPAPAPISKIRDAYRFHLLLKSKDKEKLEHLAGWIYRSSRGVFEKRKLRLKLDLQPLSFL